LLVACCVTPCIAFAREWQGDEAPPEPRPLAAAHARRLPAGESFGGHVVPVSANERIDRQPAANASARLKLPRPEASPKLPSRPNPAAERLPWTGQLNSPTTVLGSLGVVVGLFVLMAWFVRRGLPKAAAPLPREVVEVLGRAPLAGRLQMHLVRLGNKLVLVSATPTGIEAVAEITEPAEVDRLLGICAQAGPQSATAAFRQALGQLARQAETNSSRDRRLLDQFGR
jgi:flagellar biogenesis protein FliO